MRVLPAIILALVSLAGAARAEESSSLGHDEFAIYLGEFSIGRASQYETIEGGLEYRWKDQYYGLRPTVGFWANGDNATYAYAGIYWDLPLGIAPIMITPGVQGGYYSKGDSKALGYAFEFRDTIEVTYRFDGGQRFGAQLTHMSNAGLGSNNTGVEMAQVIYSHPLW